MSDEAVPHISLSLHPEHQAKELGGVVKHSLAAGDWQDTPVTNISSETTQAQQNLGGTNITYTHEGINMADGITQEEPHQCEELVSRTEKVRPDLETSPLEGPQVRQLFTDGCCFRHDAEGLKAAYAIVEQTESGLVTVEAKRLEGPQSAQRAEVMAVIAALRLTEGQEVNVSTDSAYSAGAVHLELCQWLRARFLTAGRKPIKHEAEMKELAEALLLPAKVAVIKCKGHDSSDSEVARGNWAADHSAKITAGYIAQMMMEAEEEEVREQLTLERVVELQSRAAPEEKNM
ncbi:uncharacterized protein LOC124884214 isoform X1 [Girardinichthys multiradiatus]|uniref:uncharacterized protein LOC124884214 isoform X1 n=1 Tax=Girardinichthys multiradiatus TaxID=208333 RepID=UPI001FABE39A|nr:uncharacterized protein LOC124884214 isoform X1 [Girardinichthys multiradiatus]